MLAVAPAPPEVVVPVRGRSFDGRILGGTYRVVRRLDEGAMGTVFEAEHLRLHRKVAVKVLASPVASRPDLLARFQQEAEIMSQLEHPHIVSVLDFDTTPEGEPYLVLELLHGEALESRIDRQSPLAVEDAVRITMQIASALATAHKASIVHRDLKPSNVYLTEAPGEPVFVKLLDFGISKNLRVDRRITQDRVLVGTAEYMAPEQALGRNDLIDGRTDQYALALVSYEMLTGEQPFMHSELKETLERVLSLSPRPASEVAPWIPAELGAVLARALSKSPDARFSDIAEFAEAFAAASGAEAPKSRPESAAPRSGIRLTSGGTGGGASKHLERVRASFDADEIAEAAAHAEDALGCADVDCDAGTAASIRLAEPLLARVFMRRLGSMNSRLFATHQTLDQALPLSPRAAFLSSRIEDGMTVADLLDVGWMPRLETLRWLVRLASCGAVEVGTPDGARSARSS